MTDPRPPVTRYEISTKFGRFTYVLAQEHDKEVTRLEVRYMEIIHDHERQIDALIGHTGVLEARCKEFEQSRIICKRIMGALVDSGTVPVTTPDDGGNLESGVRQLMSERDALQAKLAEAEQGTIRMCPPGTCKVQAPAECTCIVTVAALRERERRLIRLLQALLETHGSITVIDNSKKTADIACPCMSCSNARQALRDTPGGPS